MKSFRSLIFISIHIFIYCVYESLIITYCEGLAKTLNKHKGAVKTYENENGDIFDCVNIYQQPAFDNPILKNHTIQKSSHMSLPKNARCPSKHLQLHNELNLSTQRCPKGTIPILRSYKYELHMAEPERAPLVNPHRREYAFVETRNRVHRVFGAAAILDVWNPKVDGQGEYSLAQVSLVTGHGTQHHKSIEAGWMTTHNSRTKFFIRSTNNGYNSQTCFNLECANFIQTGDIEIGGPLRHDGMIAILIFKRENGDWMLYKDCEEVGYWPAYVTLFFEHGAEQVIFGGEVANIGTRWGLHTMTEMGNGRYGDEGGVAARISFLKEIRDDGDLLSKVDEHQITMNKHNCYNTVVENDHSADGCLSMYYGGMGFNVTRQCII